MGKKEEALMQIIASLLMETKLIIFLKIYHYQVNT